VNNLRCEWLTNPRGLDRAFAGDVTERKTRLAARYFRKEFETPPKPLPKKPSPVLVIR
jgi:hypothetical protein